MYRLVGQRHYIYHFGLQQGLPADRNRRGRSGQDNRYQSHWPILVFENALRSKKTPAIFQRSVDIILSRVKRQLALVYLDDMIVYPSTAEAHLKHVREVLTLLQSAGVSLNLRKCNVFETSVDYRGHVLRLRNLEVATKNFEAIKQSKARAKHTELRSFSGMCNVYRRFVPNFDLVASPLNKKLSKDRTYSFETLTEEEYEAFTSLNCKPLRPPIPVLPRHGYPYTLDIDACEYQVGYNLLQQQPNGDNLPKGY